MSSECHDAAMLMETVSTLLRACQRDIDAERRVLMKDAALRQIKALREALDAAERVLEGL